MFACGSCGPCAGRAGDDDIDTVTKIYDADVAIHGLESVSAITSRQLSDKFGREVPTLRAQTTGGSIRSFWSNGSPGGGDYGKPIDRVPSLSEHEMMLASESAAFRQEEEHRGVRMDDYYDFYDTAERRLLVRRITSALAGRGAMFAPPTFGTGSSCGSTSSAADTSDPGELSSVIEDPSMQSLEKKDLSSSPKLPKGQATQTNWAVLVATLVRTRVMGFQELAERILHTHPTIEKNNSYRLMASVARRAQGCATAAIKLAKQVSKEADCLHAEWQKTNLLSKLFTSEYVDTLLILANSARKVFEAQPMLIRVKAPCKIFGDIHGQLRDLLLLFHAFGHPDKEAGPIYIFNGDFVDRGSHQLEVIGLLFALKVLMPDKIYLIRGNHEDRSMNAKYGFWDDCRKRLGKEFGGTAYDHIHKAFDQLPIACVVSDRVLVVHGGIGDGRWTLGDVANIKRPLDADQLYETNWIFNILWSDPLDKDAEDAGANTFGVHASPRRADVVTFGWNVTKTFCARNGISLIVRSHECKLGGMGFDVMHDRRLMRVFSARDYEENGNSAAALLISQDAMPVQTSNGLAERGILTVRPQVLLSTIQATGEVPQREPSASSNNSDPRTKMKKPKAKTGSTASP